MADFSKLNFSVSFNRTSAFPLEANSYFTSYLKAEEAAKIAVEPGSADSVYYIGLLIVVVENKLAVVYVILPNKTLKIVSGSTGIPTYTLKMLDELDEKPDRYIIIPDKETDLNNTPISNEIVPNGNYVDILFSALRKLLSEVARLKNAFLYGMYSYTDDNTAMSRVLNGINDPDDEPLWAVEEEDLSLINEVVIGGGHGLEPSSTVNIGKEGILTITGEATWYDLQSIIENTTDPKLFQKMIL